MYVDYAKVYRWNATGSAVQKGDVSETAAKNGFGVQRMHNGLQISMPYSGRFSVSVCTIDGRIVASQRGSGASCVLDAGGLGRGAYVVKMTGNWGVFSKRVALE
jgi:hypothetical protein